MNWLRTDLLKKKCLKLAGDWFLDVEYGAQDRSGGAIRMKEGEFRCLARPSAAEERAEKTPELHLNVKKNGVIEDCWIDAPPGELLSAEGFEGYGGGGGD